MKITMRELRAVGICSKGARAAAKRAGINWQEFLDNGMELEELCGKVDPHYGEKLREHYGRR